MVVSLGRIAAGESDKVRLLRARQRLAAAFLAFVGQYRFHPARDEVVAYPLDRVAADVEGAADLGLAPAVAEFEQYLGARACTGAGMPAMDADVQALAVVVGQAE